MQVIAKHLNRIRVGTLLQLKPDLSLDRRIEQPLPRIFNSQFKLWRPITLFPQYARTQNGPGTQRIKFNKKVQNRFSLTPSNRKHSMRRYRLHRLAILVIHLEFFLLVDSIDRLATDDDALLEHEMAERLTQISILADDLCNDVTRAFQSFLNRADLFLSIDKAGGKLRQRNSRRFLRPQVKCKR